MIRTPTPTGSPAVPLVLGPLALRAAAGLAAVLAVAAWLAPQALPALAGGLPLAVAVAALLVMVLALRPSPLRIEPPPPAAVPDPAATAASPPRAGPARAELELLDALPLGVVLWDADERLLYASRDFRARYAPLADLLVPGVTFETLVRAGVERRFVPEAVGREEAWIAERLAQHRSGRTAVVRRFGPGWVRLVERRLPDGRVLAWSVDVTDLVEKEAEVEQARGAAERATRLLAEAIEALPVGFELYDADDRLILTNSQMRQMLPKVAHLIPRQPTFEALARANFQHGGLEFGDAGAFEAWLADRLRRRREPGAPQTQRLADGRWMRAYDRRLPDGGLVGVRLDVTALMKGEAELMELNGRLQRLSQTDALTGLANRRVFDERLAAECGRASRHGTALALLLIDVDHFKAYNDRHGHPAGDRCLQQVAQALMSMARRPGDLAARIGGEEFALLLPHVAPLDALAAARGAIAAVDAMLLLHGASPVAPHVTVSIGAAAMAPVDGSARVSPDAVLASADGALYRAKAAGRHRAELVEFTEPATEPVGGRTPAPAPAAPAPRSEPLLSSAACEGST